MPAPMTERDVLRVAQARVLSLPEARCDVCQAAVALKAAFVEDAMRQSPAFWNAVGGVIESVDHLQNIDVSGGSEVAIESGVDAIEISTSSGSRVIVPRADFLAAVESELDVRLVSKDAVVVERGDLPAVTVAEGGAIECGEVAFAPSRNLAADARGFAAQYLAIADHLDSLPQYDEAEVEALADLMVEHEQEVAPPTAIERRLGVARRRVLARRLLATGRVHVSGEAGA